MISQQGWMVTLFNWLVLTNYNGWLINYGQCEQDIQGWKHHRNGKKTFDDHKYWIKFDYTTKFVHTYIYNQHSTSKWMPRNKLSVLSIQIFS